MTNKTKNIKKKKLVRAGTKANPLGWLFLLVLGLIGYISLGFIILAVLPNVASYNYENQKCYFQPTLLPSLFENKDIQYKKTYTGKSLSIGNRLVFSQQTCLSPESTPTENSNHLHLSKFLGLIPSQLTMIRSQSYPKANLSKITNQKLSTILPLELDLDKPDEIFDYVLSAQDKTSMCHSDLHKIICPTNSLELPRGSKVPITLERSYNNRIVGSLFENNITTLEALVVDQTSVVSESIVYENLESLSVTFDKTLSKTEEVNLSMNDDELKTIIETSATINDKRLTINFLSPLQRNKKYTLSINQAYSTENHTLESPFSFSFYLSGGPAVSSSNFKTYGFDTNQNLIVYFDQNINTTQDLRPLISISANGSPVAFNPRVSNNSITIDPLQSLPACTDINVSINNAVQNIYGISGNSGWSYKFRTLCRRVGSIGVSSQGRSLTSYWFGNGSNIVVFAGGIHGNEVSSVIILNSLLDDLERNYHKIPADKTIVVIPNLNPDGYSSGRRLNSRNVDLNRNFPASDWKPDVNVPGYNSLIGGGGSAPLSENESSAFANFISLYRPKLTMTYHSAGAIVSPNESSNSSLLASQYSKLSGFTYYSGSNVTDIFAYDTTGSFEEWSRQIGLANILVELSTHSANEFSRHQSAIWAMINQ